MDGIIGSIGAMLVLVLALLPGVPGDRLMGSVVGRSWLEKDWQYVIRVLSYSTLGLIGYALLASWRDWPPPIHVLPATFGGTGLSPADLPRVGYGYLGHLVVSTLVGAASGLVQLGVKAWMPNVFVRHRDAWDEFVRFCAPGRWVVATLRDGRVYVGMLEQADTSRGPQHRDLLIQEPALWEEDVGNYRATGELYLYVGGEQITSLSAITDPDRDARVTESGKLIFEGEKVDEQQKEQAG